MELRKLYKQGKSIVLVIPAKYLLACDWRANDQIEVLLLPDQTLKLTRYSSSSSSSSSSPSLFNPSQGGHNVGS